MIDKQKYLYVAIGLIVLLIYGVVVFLVINGQRLAPASTIEPTPTPIISIKNQTQPLINYDTVATKKLEKILSERNKLSTDDQLIRKKIVQTLNYKSGTLEKTENYLIRYIQPLDLFQVEINSIDIAGTKESVSKYFISKGISENGICYLPLAFSLSKQVTDELTGKNLSFSPLPQGC